MFSGGYTGKLLRVDLGRRQSRVEQVPERLYRALLGGRGVAAWYYWKELGPEVDPLGPENKLIFFTGPLTGLALPFHHQVPARHPLAGDPPVPVLQLRRRLRAGPQDGRLRRPDRRGGGGGAGA